MKKAVSSIVAKSLLLVVGVVSIVTFNIFYSSFSSQIYSDIESEQNTCQIKYKVTKKHTPTHN